jgi:hypothetical protein
VACDSKKSAQEFRSLFNMISSYRRYLHPDKDGHQFINKWVREYIQHRGEMCFDDDILQYKNL